MAVEVGAITRHSPPFTAFHRLPPPSTALYFDSHMTKPAAAKPAPLYPTRSAAGALLGQQLAGRGYLGCLLLGITPEGVEIAANASKAMGAQFDVLVAAFIKLGSNLAPIGAIAESAPSEMDADFQPGGALLDKLASAIDESRARVKQDLILYRTERPVKKLAGRIAVIVDGQVTYPWRVLAAAKVAEQLGAKQVVIATPVATQAAADRIARPGTCVPGQHDRVDPATPVHRRLGPNQRRVRGGAVGVVSAGHVHLDIPETPFRQVCLQGGECLGRGHIGDEAQVEFGYRPVRKNRLATRPGVSADEALDVDGGARHQELERLAPAHVVHPVVDAQLLLRHLLVETVRRFRDHGLLRGRERARLVGEPVDGGVVAAG